METKEPNNFIEQMVISLAETQKAGYKAGYEAGYLKGVADMTASAKRIVSEVCHEAKKEI